MKNFLDRFKPPKNGSQKGNPLNGLFGGTQSFSGSGQSLGGSQPGKIITVTLSDPGTLGIQLEKHKGAARKTSIVANVIPGSQAETAGLQRGDVLCFAGSNGQEEILYDMFLELAASTQRPLHFEARRVPEVKATRDTANKSGSAQDYARRQAVIAAAEKREKAHKQKTKPIPKVNKDALPKLLSTAEKQKQEKERQERIQQESHAPLSAATQQALQQAKSAEARTSAELGYNPYEVKNMTSGQARNAVTATTHGTIAESAADGGGGPGAVRPPSATPSTTETPPLSPGFASAFETMVTAGTDHAQVVASLSILERLITNAITKQHDVKFRKVRLANPKIQAAVAAVPGAVDVLLETGFVLRTDDATNESILLHEGDTPVWWKTAVQHMERYRLQGGSM